MGAFSLRRLRSAPCHNISVIVPATATAQSGRPRDPRIDAAVLDATVAALGRSGYGALTFEEVAREAGTTKPAIYRRWSSRPRLVLAALGRRLGSARAPDTGCTLCDLDECLKLFVASFRRIPPGVLGPLFADCAGDRDLRAAFMSTLFEPPRAAVKETLERARERGDLRADVEPELILDLIGSLVHYRALFGHAPTSDAEIERAVEALLQGIAADYPALLEHSRQTGGDPKLHALHSSATASR
jgi:AcrR family transcriptional regulator